eukprot:scaffold11881_cov52-Phaeocystis_antarctica.AAC.3
MRVLSREGGCCAMATQSVLHLRKIMKTSTRTTKHGLGRCALERERRCTEDREEAGEPNTNPSPNPSPNLAGYTEDGEEEGELRHELEPDGAPVAELAVVE